MSNCITCGIVGRICGFCADTKLGKLQSQLQTKDAEIEKLQAQLEKAERVIDKYANDNNWDLVPMRADGEGSCAPIFCDNYLLAREYQAEKDKV